jgi:hypothetical protein
MSSFDLPQFESFVRTCRGEITTIRAERDRRDAFRIAEKCAFRPALIDTPQPYGAIVASRGNRRPPELKATAITVAVCPSNTCCCELVATSKDEANGHVPAPADVTKGPIRNNLITE